VNKIDWDAGPDLQGLRSSTVTLPPPVRCDNEAVTDEADAADAADDAGWPFGSVSEAAEWWYRPVVEARSWVALGYLAVGAIWAPVLFAIILTMLAITLPLIIVGLGLLLVVPTFALINTLTSVERHRATWVGASIPPRSFRSSPAGGSWLGPVTTRLADPERWRQVAFSAAFLVAGPLFFALGLLPWGILWQLTFSGGSINFGGLLLAVAIAGAAPRVTLAVVNVARSFTAWFLGPDEAVELQERVDELSTQREQILEAVADERRRIERNLHDGVQQQLVALGIDIGRATARLDEDPDGARELLDDARDKVRSSIGELRVIGRGLHPAVLEDRGLDAALSSVVANTSLPISVDMTFERALPDDVAATAYYVVNEAVANILKHAKARVGSIHIDEDPSGADAIRITVHDDGQGGADAHKGSGLAGIRARVEGADGSFSIESPEGGPTTLVAVIPVGLPGALS
jgi:signal transduction histidine kinase